MARDQLQASLLGRYSIERELGQGGMATVYLAHDARHDRKVALKVLKPELAAVLGGERFVVEIKTTAALQHPHILPLFDSGEADGFLYYVMPFIDGETLRAKLDRDTQLGVDEAVKIAVDVADALHYAHTHGVIHRDIKPENILLANGRPMVADFGIALAVSAAAGGRMTETGLSLGTPHYMSPEQATAEKEITARSDVYSLGSVLYEMLTGDPPHTGSSAQQVIMKIITEPSAPVTTLRKSVPPNVAAAVAKSLEKLPADRFASAAAFAAALQDRAFTTTHAPPQATRTSAARRLRDPLFVGVSLLALVASAFVARSLLQSRASEQPGVVRFEIAGTGRGHPVNSGTWPATVSPDGRTIVYTGETSNGSSQLFVRHVGELEARPLAGTDNPMEPFFSPDGKWLGFWADNTLKKMQLDGGTPIALTAVTDVNGAAWTTRGTIVVGQSPPHTGLVVVAEGDGHVTPLTTSPNASGVHVWPVLLGDGRHVAFAIAGPNGNDKAQLAVTSLDDGVVHPLGVTGVRPIGEIAQHLVYLTPAGVVMAVLLDANRARATGIPVALLDSKIRMCDECNGDGPISLSNGSLLYMPGSQSSQMAWVDRRGVEQSVMKDKKAFNHPRRSPDGRRIAVEVNEGGRRDIWICEVATDSCTKLTESGDNTVPEWTYDGAHIVFRSNRHGTSDIWWQPADFSTEATPLYESKGESRPLAFVIPSPDGQTILYRASSVSTFALSGDRTPRAYLANTDRSQITAFQFSPDGKSVVYSSSESGQFEIVLRSFPNPGAKMQVSIGGGIEPRWSADGRQIFYANGRRVMVATLATTPTLRVVSRDSLFRAPFPDLLTPGPASYDVSADGLRFLMLKPSEDRRALVVVLNWASEVAARLRAK